ncbi:MAG: DNA polymerase III subunit gamma/tau [Bacteroidales bacterium]|nr:DNA polymerase III subunit gamma/tau [Bacteroidales bacterium]
MSDSNRKYIVSARKYRPATFKTVVGQKNLTVTLKNAISSGRLAQAYLFCGPRGVGKTSCARIFAKTINCLNPTPDGEACGECESCRAIERGNSYNLIELDAASNNSVNDIRAITEQVNIPPQSGKYRVFIIDEVHMLSSAAFNAFLKTLEEPPSYVIFILATTEKHKVIPTILSRCQIYDFKRITIDDTIDHLEYVAQSEGISTERRALGVIARKADGAMRDALSIFDQVAASCDGDVTYDKTIESLNVLDYEYYFRLTEAFAKSDIPDALLLYKEIRDKGFDSLFFIDGLGRHLRDLMVAADPKTLPLLELPADTAERFRQQAGSLPLKWYYAALKILNECDFNYRTASNKQLLVEVALIRLCQLLSPAEPPFNGTYRNPGLQNPTAAPVSASPQSPAAPARPAPVSSTPQSPETPQSPSAPPSSPASAQPAPPSPPKPMNHQPVVTPSSAPSSAPRRPAPKPQTVRLTDNTPTERLSTERRNNPVTLEALQEAWNNFIIANPDQRILTSAMRSASLSMPRENEIHLLLDHPAQKQAFESSPKLISFLRDSLRNDFLAITSELDTSKEVAKILPPKEFLIKAIAKNNGLGEFLKSIQAELD